MLLNGKVALITGANRGIGLAIAERFAAEGAHVVVTARSADAADELAKRLHETYGMPVEACALDVSQPGHIAEAFQAIYRKVKRLDVLVNNAGELRDALIGMVTVNDVQQTFAVNTFGTLYCAQKAARWMTRQKMGSIINVCSIVGVNGNAGQAVYSASKAAVVGLTKSLAKELAPLNIRCNAIAPGFIDTDMARSIPADKFQERKASIRMGRLGEPVEVANVAVFLASDLASYVTGQVIGVDGGMLI